MDFEFIRIELSGIIYSYFDSLFFSLTNTECHNYSLNTGWIHSGTRFEGLFTNVETIQSKSLSKRTNVSWQEFKQNTGYISKSYNI